MFKKDQTYSKYQSPIQNYHSSTLKAVLSMFKRNLVFKTASLH